MSMSSFDVKMEVDGKTYNVVNLNYSVGRDMDYTGRPASQLKNSVIDIELEVPDGDVMLYKWLCLNETKDGKIVFNKIDQASTHIQLQYKTAFCVYYKQLYLSGPKALTVSVKITAQTLTFTSGGQEFEQTFFPNV